MLSVDKKTGIQAVERRFPDEPPAAGRLRRREFEYIRHGTQALNGASFRSHTGRWNPLPVEGTRQEVIEEVVAQLGPYLTPENY